MPKRMPTLVLRTGNNSYTSGHCWVSKHRIVMTVGCRDDAAGALGTLAHEVAHLLTPDDEPAHGRGFWSLVVDLVVGFYGAKVTIEDIDQESRSFTKQQAIDAAIRAARGYA